MMRGAVALALLFSFLSIVPAGAEERSEAAAERWKAARVAMEAKLKIGDVLRLKGDLDGALRCYEEALRIYERALEAGRAVRIPAPVAAPAPKRKSRRVPAAAAGRERNPIEAALRWLADHQDVDTDGRWDSDGFSKHDPSGDRCDGPGGALYDVGATGISLLAFLGAGYTDRGAKPLNKYAKNVRMGLRFLMESQDEQGVFGTRATHGFMYNHAIATLALCEAYSMTRNPRYKKAAQDGVEFILMARNPYLAWRYEPRGGENDTSVTAWCVSALDSARRAGLQVDPAAFLGARQWIDKMTDPQFGQVGYNYPGGAPARPEGKQDDFPPEKSQSMTAAGILTRMYCREDPQQSEAIRKGARLCTGVPPVWDPKGGTIDMYYWFYGTQALFRVGGPEWRRWSVAMKKAILGSQRGPEAGASAGSWDPIGVWGDDAGRVVSTALMTLCLEIYFRYDHVIGVR